MPRRHARFSTVYIQNAVHCTNSTAEHASAERAVLPLRVKAYFCDLRSPLRSRSVSCSAGFFRLPLTCSVAMHAVSLHTGCSWSKIWGLNTTVSPFFPLSTPFLCHPFFTQPSSTMDNTFPTTPTLVSNATTLHREPDMRHYPDPQHLCWQSFCSCRSRAMEQFTAISQSQRCWLTVQSAPAVIKDIFVWIVGPRHSANYFNCAV